MKKNLIALVIVIALAGLAVYFISSYSKTTIKQELKDFAVKDTASVTKIFLADRKGNKILLERQKDNSWTVNKDHAARPDAVKLLLETMNRIRIDAPVPKTAFNTTIKMLASDGTKVEIYQNDKLSKVYYVGGTTQDYRGTIMMIENSSAPFIMVIPGFEGYLTTRYFTDLNLWKATGVFAYDIPQIESVTVENMIEPSNSFRLELLGPNTLKLNTLQPEREISNFDTLKAKQYLLGFKNVRYEFMADKIKPELRDSVLKTNPLYTITVKAKDGSQNKITCYPKKAAEGATTPTGEPLLVDVDRMWGQLNNEKHLVVIQYFVFDKLLIPVSVFMPSRS